jgi:hypothetical protein
VDNSLFVMKTMMIMMTMERGDPTENGSSSVSPPIFDGSNSISLILCFCSAPFKIASGYLFIVVFRSRLEVGVEDGRLRALEEETIIASTATP